MVVVREGVCAAVSLAGLPGLGFWWICLDLAGFHGLRSFYMPLLAEFSFGAAIYFTDRGHRHLLLSIDDFPAAASTSP